MLYAVGCFFLSVKRGSIGKKGPVFGSQLLCWNEGRVGGQVECFLFFFLVALDVFRNAARHLFRAKRHLSEGMSVFFFLRSEAKRRLSERSVN